MIPNQPVLSEMQYWGAISWYRLLSSSSSVVFDRHEHYRKGTYRNRCHIMGPNGMLKLSVPLVKGKFQHSAFGKVRVSYTENWRKDHWMSLVSSYRRSAYFEFYEEDIAPIFKEEYEYLWQLNEATFKTILSLLKKELPYAFSEQYFPEMQFQGSDIRSMVLPNVEKQVHGFYFPDYPQVFMDRMDFLPDLSVLDLLFNLGPRAASYISALSLKVHEA